MAYQDIGRRSILLSSSLDQKVLQHILHSSSIPLFLSSSFFLHAAVLDTIRASTSCVPDAKATGSYHAGFKTLTIKVIASLPFLIIALPGPWHYQERLMISCLAKIDKSEECPI